MTLLCNTAKNSVNCDRNSVISCAENNRKYTLNNCCGRKYKIGKLQYDGKYYTGGDEAADYILLSCENPEDSPKVAIIVELKGTSVDKAYTQIAATISREKELLRDYAVFARTVAKSVRKASQNSPKRCKLISMLVTLGKKQQKIPVSKLFIEKEALSEKIEELYNLLQ